MDVKLRVSTLVLTFVALAAAKDSRVTPYVIDTVLRDYITSELPNPDGSTDVEVGIYVNNVQLDYQKGIMDLSVYFRNRWTDPRLKPLFENTDVNNTRIASEDDIKTIWKPDLFVRNSDKVAKVDAFTKEELLRVNRQGQVWHVIRLINAMNCPDILRGGQTVNCSIMFESFGYTKDSLTLSWLDNPVDVDKGVVLTSHTLEDIVLYDCSQNYTAGSFPCLEIKFILTRDSEASTFDKGIYIVSILLVIISWLAFWIPPSDKRIFIGLGTGFILSILYLSIAEWREYSYVTRTTAAQGWTIFCLVLVLAMVLEYALVYVLCGTLRTRVSGLCGGSLNDMEPKRTRCGDIMDTLFGLIIFPVIFIIGLITFGVASAGFK